MMDHVDVIRSYYQAYEASDRGAVEELLSSRFTFTSPLDDNIDRARYFAKCWPGNEHITRFRLDQVAVDGDHALIRYEATETAGTTFRNVEHFAFDGDYVSHIDVYFGAVPDSLS